MPTIDLGPVLFDSTAYRRTSLVQAEIPTTADREDGSNELYVMTRCHSSSGSEGVSKFQGDLVWNNPTRAAKPTPLPLSDSLFQFRDFQTHIP